MKTIKKLGKDYCKPDTNEVDWSKVVGKRCVVDVSITVGENGAYSDLLIEDFDSDTGLLKYKVNEESFWNDLEFYKTWILMFVYEPVETPVKRSTLSDEMKLLLETAKAREERNNPPSWPAIPRKFKVPCTKCSKCGIDFGTGPIGYVCNQYPCPAGLGGVYCNMTRSECPSEHETGSITASSSYAD